MTWQPDVIFVQREKHCAWYADWLACGDKAKNSALNSDTWYFLKVIKVEMQNFVCVVQHVAWKSDDYFFGYHLMVIPAYSTAQPNHAMSAKHIVDYLSHAFFQTCTHLH